MLHRILLSRGALFGYFLLASYVVFEGWMAFEAPRRIEAGLLDAARAATRVAVFVRLPFPPERFHVLKVQEWGRIRGVSGNTIDVSAIDANGIQQLARNYYWIDRIEARKQTP